MPKLHKGNLVGHQWGEINLDSFSDRLVGIEIEVENAPGLELTDPESSSRPKMVAAPNWCAVADNSLRNHGAEFVSFPLPISKVNEAVKSLFDFKKTNLLNWKGSVRTGIHVHVNVRDFGDIQLQNLLVAFALIEPALFDFVGKEREECIYCVPWYRAPGDAKHSAVWLDPKHRIPFSNRMQELTAPLAKYSSLYLAPITRIGTVEFRMAPTWLEEGRISMWAVICEQVVSYAASMSGYSSILEQFDSNPQKWAESVTSGYLSAPAKYLKLVEATGSDILARTMFPEECTEWVRFMDKYTPFSQKGQSMFDTPFPKIKKPKKYIQTPGFYKALDSLTKPASGGNTVLLSDIQAFAPKSYHKEWVSASPKVNKQIAVTPMEPLEWPSFDVPDDVLEPEDL